MTTARLFPGVAVLALAALAGGCGSSNDKNQTLEDQWVFDSGDTASHDARPADEAGEQTGDDVNPNDVTLDLKDPADTKDAAGDVPPEETTDSADNPDIADGVLPQQPSISLLALNHWQRGPVNLMVDVEGSEGGYTVELVWARPSEADASATEMAGFGDGTGPFSAGMYRFVWESMTDLQEDVDVTVKARLKAGGDVVATSNPITVQLRNDPSRDRAALVTNGINGASIVRAPIFNFQTGFSLTAPDMTSGKAPMLVTFHPGGISAVTCDQDDYQLSFYAVSEDSVVSQAIVIPTPDRYFDDIEWSEDGKTLYLLDFNPTDDAGVYTLELDHDTGLPQAGASPKQLSHHWAGNVMDLLPGNEGYVVAEGNEADPGTAILLSVMDMQGSLVGQHKIVSDGSSPQVLEVTPDGSQLLLGYYNLFGEGDKLILFLLHPGDDPERMADVDVYDPWDLDYTEDGTKALLAESQGNKLTVILLGGGLALSKGTSLTIGLPSDVFSMHWGPKADLFMVSTVSGSTGISALAMVTIEGSGPVKSGSWDLGDGIEHLIDSAGMQQ